MPLTLAVRFEKPVSRRWTDREELAPTFFTQMETPMPLQRLGQRWQKEDQPFAHTTCRFPGDNLCYNSP